jgi:hypothetical protein
MNHIQTHVRICAYLLVFNVTIGLAQTAENAPSSLRSVVAAYLAKEGLKYEYLADASTFRLNMVMPHGTINCAIVVKEEYNRVIMISSLPATVTAGNRVMAAEYLMRANFGLPLGNFELDYSDGEVRYKTSIDVTGGTLSEEMMKSVFSTNISVVHRYLPGLLKILSGQITPESAIREAERDLPEHNHDLSPPSTDWDRPSRHRSIVGTEQVVFV